MTARAIAILLLLIAPLLAACDDVGAQNDDQKGPPPASVRTVTALVKQMAPMTRLPGTVVAEEDSRIAAELAGIIVWLADIGAEVEAGAPVARIDDREFKLAAARAEAAIRRLEARLVYENQQVDRLSELARTNHTPQSRYEEAIADRDMVAEDLNEARLALSGARLALERTIIRAPFTGQIVERLAGLGEYAAPGRELARLVATRAIEISAQTPIGYASALTAGQPVDIFSAGGPGSGRIRAVIGAGDAISRSIEIRISTDGDLPVGSAVEIGLPVGAERAVVAVPRDALILRPGQTFLWVIGADGGAKRVDVTTGAADGPLVEVVGDIAAGDRVVIRGGERLRPGQMVSIDGDRAG